MRANLFCLSVLLLVSMVGCDSKSNSTSNSSDKLHSSSYSSQNHYSKGYSSNDSDDEDDEYNESSATSNSNDGTHSATVDYYNPQTGYSQTYNLNVEIEDGQVKQINFPNGGYLDDSHITPADIENGHAEVEGEDGKTYDVTIDD